MHCILIISNTQTCHLAPDISRYFSCFLFSKYNNILLKLPYEHWLSRGYVLEAYQQPITTLNIWLYLLQQLYPSYQKTFATMWQSQSQAHIISKIFTSQWYYCFEQRHSKQYWLLSASICKWSDPIAE